MPVPKGKMPQRKNQTSYSKGHKQHDLTGMVFGRLTVLGYAGKQSNKSMWECLCSCGNIKTSRSDALKSGACQSCGCLHKDRVKSKDDSHKAARHDEISIYKRAAMKRGLEFSLNSQQFTFLIKGNCFYCNSKPLRKITYKKGTELINGIDRLDNNKGYTIDNCVPCCKRCNWMKSNMTTQEFFEIISKIYRKHMYAS